MRIRRRRAAALRKSWTQSFETPTVELATIEHPTLERLETLLRGEEAATLAFQSVLAALLPMLERVLQREQQAADASLSLAQRETLQEMTETLATAIQMLRGALNERGQQVLRYERPVESGPPERSWWFALSEALEAVEDALQRIPPLVRAQPRSSLSRRVGALLLRLLRQHQRHLLHEAREWIE
ncbi:hypothetical protein [Rhodothermus marinus]|uniref:Uncharacterized protein n=1 Tax=Rhodothermus marinus (strain ATCC 43812 / DSM 4252 / R-10) TaxID=518766 RepID=D0MDL1_RHOM4|nr:hypothetical protein [Rhodothermus marinus]ACY47204.1 hypothetical protein Rmar_0299 [Rhodothermus marinus DSM 4252]